jgi:hypothetical protein
MDAVQPEMKMKRTLEQRINAARKTLRESAYPIIKAPTFRSFIRTLGAPKGDFNWDGEAGDWTPYWCDDCNTFHKTAQSLDIIRKGRHYCLITRTVDEDGNWEMNDHYESDDGADAWRLFYIYNLSERQSYDHFKGWAEYHLWCAEEGGEVDPLNEFIDGKPTRKRHVEAAEDHLKYLTKYA